MTCVELEIANSIMDLVRKAILATPGLLSEDEVIETAWSKHIRSSAQQGLALVMATGWSGEDQVSHLSKLSR